MPKVFISYSWEDEEHKKWVIQFAERLMKNGIDVIIDQFDLVLGDRIPVFMEHSISEADYVLIICTPTYKSKANNRKGGVGYEGNIISAELYSRGNERKYIPVIRKGSIDTAIPSYLTGKLGIDLTGNNDYEGNFRVLVATIIGDKEIITVEKKKDVIGSVLHSISSNLNIQTSDSLNKSIINEQNRLGDMYRHGQGVAQNYQKAVECYRKSAEQGDAYAQGELGWMYLIGYGVPQDYAQAAYWCQKSAIQGGSNGQNSLGYLYENGWGVSQDYKLAFEWYKRAAEQGNPYSQNKVGYMYDIGRGITQNYELAFEWYQKAANQDILYAQNRLGDMYRHGLGVPQNYRKSVECYRKSAEQGDAYAQGELGWMYLSGYGVPQDFTQAAEWCRKSADQGGVNGQNTLGIIYEHGYGVPRNFDLAIEWYRKAANQGFKYAQNHLDDLCNFT